MMRTLATVTLAMAALVAVLPSSADAKPKIALTAIDGDSSGSVGDALTEALDGDELTVISQRTVNKAYDLPHGYRRRVPGEKIASLDPSSRFDQSRWSQLVKDVFEESLGYRLAGGDLADRHGALAVVLRQFKDGSYGVLAFLRQIHMRLLSTPELRSILMTNNRKHGI